MAERDRKRSAGCDVLHATLPSAPAVRWRKVIFDHESQQSLVPFLACPPPPPPPYYSCLSSCCCCFARFLGRSPGPAGCCPASSSSSSFVVVIFNFFMSVSPGGMLGEKKTKNKQKRERERAQSYRDSKEEEGILRPIDRSVLDIGPGKEKKRKTLNVVVVYEAKRVGLHLMYGLAKRGVLRGNKH